tara:strand:+ start:781 stop:1350 length:570 start_codon:yes stop_codon:yes gene_type:complete
MKLKNTIQSMQKLGNNIIKEGRSILKKKKKQTKSNTLYKDFDYLVTSNKNGVTLTFEFGGASDYWDFVDEGVQGSGSTEGRSKTTGQFMRGQGSPFKFKGNNIARGVVAKWIANKPLKLRGAGGKFVEKNQQNIKSAAFLIGRAIAQRGLERTQFFSKPFTQQLNKQTDAIVEAFGNDLDKQLEIIIGT